MYDASLSQRLHLLTLKAAHINEALKLPIAKYL